MLISVVGLRLAGGLCAQILSPSSCTQSWTRVPAILVPCETLVARCSHTPPRYNPDYAKFPRFAQAVCGQAIEGEPSRNVDLGCCTECSGNCIPRCLADMPSRCFILLVPGGLWPTHLSCSLSAPGAILPSVLVAPYSSGWSCTRSRATAAISTFSDQRSVAGLGSSGKLESRNIRPGLALAARRS